MDHKNSDMRSNMENAIPNSSDYRDYQNERSRIDYGRIIRINTKYNRNKMGEAIAFKVLNMAGGIMVLLGIFLPNIFQANDIVSVLVKIFSLGFVTFKLFTAYENWRMKRVERKRMEDDYKASKLKVRP